MPRLIICADDYGLTNSVNRGIEACLSAGAVQSTCVMPNMEEAITAQSLHSKYPETALGLHWTLTAGRPLSPAEAVPTLVDNVGTFHSFSVFRQRLRARRISMAEVRLELRTQLNRLRDIAGDIEFWNTHQNVHLWPGLFHLFVKLAMDEGIIKMRCNSRVTLVENRFGYNLGHPTYLIKGKVLDAWSYASRKKGMTMPNGLVAMPKAGPGKMKLEECLKRFRLPLSRPIVEASLHPADEPANPSFGMLCETRYLEYQMFSDEKIKSRLLKLGIECISFRHLNA